MSATACYCLQVVSNQALTQEELERYFRHREKIRRRPMSKAEQHAAKDKITAAVK